MASKRPSVPEFDHRHYVPCVRWKQGEYQALLRLKPETKQRITPLIEVPELGWDFERGAEAKTLDDLLGPFAKRVEQKWGYGLCFVDLNLLGDARMPDESSPVTYVFSDLRDRGCAAVPVIGLERGADYHRAVRRIARTDGRGVCLRLTLTQATQRNALAKVADLLLTEKGNDVSNTDIVLDLEAPGTFLPVEGFAKLISNVLAQLGGQGEWRTVTVLGTSFPQTMSGLQRGPQTIPRYEWILYKKLCALMSREGKRLPAFGDYCIAHPAVRTWTCAPRDHRQPYGTPQTTPGTWSRARLSETMDSCSIMTSAAVWPRTAVRSRVL